MAMTQEEKRIAKNEASKRWYAKHKAAKASVAKSERPDAETGNAFEKQSLLEENPQDGSRRAENEQGCDAECSDCADEWQDDKVDLDDNDKDELDDNEDEDYWAAGREEMFRELDAQGYMEED